MPARKSFKGKRSQPKNFRCMGFGDCNMVFNRGEHLSRHQRKHTGEKPFECTIIGCNKSFSRYDNMMQHTQTHTKNRQKSSAKNATAAAQLIKEELANEPVPCGRLSMLGTRSLPPIGELTSSPVKDYFYDFCTNNTPAQPSYENEWCRRSSNSSSDSSLFSSVSSSGVPQIRRLSINDLCNPIESPDATIIQENSNQDMQKCCGRHI